MGRRVTTKRALLFLAIASLPIACGARTDLSGPPEPEPAPFDAGHDAKDASHEDSGRDARPDAPILPDAAREAGPPCTGDDQCPLSYGCDPVYGCQARALASSPSGLYEVQLPSCVTRRIAPTTRSFLDIGLSADRTLYGIAGDGLFTLSATSGQDQLLRPLEEPTNAFDVAPDGKLYAGGGANVFAVDPSPTADAGLTYLMPFPAGSTSSGDVAFLQGRFLATATGVGTPSDMLVELDVANQEGHVIGPIGASCVYGLAAFGKDLYGFTCNGEVLAIDAAKGSGRVLANVGVTFYGATAR